MLNKNVRHKHREILISYRLIKCKQNSDTTEYRERSEDIFSCKMLFIMNQQKFPYHRATRAGKSKVLN